MGKLSRTRFDIFQLNQNWFYQGSNAWTMAKVVLWGLNSVILLLGVTGMMLTLRRRHPASILMVPILYTTIVFLPLNSFENRYSQPVYPFIIIFATLAIMSLKDKCVRTPVEIN